MKHREIKLVMIARSGTSVTQLELLVPIRLEICFRLKDTFTWNLNDPVVTPEVFAQCLCDDYQISSNSVVQAVAKSITEQLQEHRAHIIEPAPGSKREEVRGKMSEVYQEWTVVARSIREQVSIYQKSLFPTGHPFDGAPSSTTNSGRLWIDTSFPFDRTLLEQFTPQFDVLQEAGIERNERERERELKHASNGNRQPAPVTYHRAAAAAAASLTIANLAATENGTSPVQTPMHEPPQSAGPGEANGRSTTPPAASPQSQVSAQTRDWFRIICVVTGRVSKQ
ncbi:hypothetical protein RSOLAG22IIIB_04778 [Rhizoctonia solani]|uniref:SWI/SNF-related matrix-associated actin-dependent regulator of chromatin subfamily B member 1 n=1 Tax=Rhizoctonia solani TaxID=456999 RepID=A0A0K6G0G1_9AGAM|nr:hypothetical protein RSOLAG22IIIB_04778 [Rhizoctonia solani]